jgi:uncharacterized damage-inducible protein DinB
MAWMPNAVLDSFTVHTSRWGAPMTVEAMLEHAVAHPMRHHFQLEELLAKAGKSRPARTPGKRRAGAQRAPGRVASQSRRSKPR